MKRRLVVLALLVAGVASACAPSSAEVVHRTVDPVAAESWALPTHRYRLPVTVSAAGTERNDRTVVVPVDFGDSLVAAHALGRFDSDSLRVVEVDDDGAAIDDEVVYQYDPNPTDAESGELLVLLTGTTGPDEVRRFDVYFDLVGTNIAPVEFEPLVVTAQDVLDESNPSIRARTPNGTWFVRESSGGGSSLVDETGADWLAYNLAPEAQGQFRGMPNAVRGYGYFHPDFKRSPTEIVRSGPLRTRIEAESRSGLWRVRWDIFPTYADVTITKSAWEYYLMFEGLPGGDINADTDMVIRSDGVVSPLGEAWTGDLPGEEWTAFTDPGKGRGVFVAHAEQDDVVDSYRLMDNGMTVMGFGREDVQGHLRGQHTMTVGLTEVTSYDEIAPLVQDAIRKPPIDVGDVEVRPR